MNNPLKSLLISTVLTSAFFSTGIIAQTAAPAAVKETAAITADNALLLTVFLRHDQSRSLSELRAQLHKQDFFKSFPPPGVEVVSWNITMGIGHIIVLRLPASKLVALNMALESTAWGPYKTEFFPSYDYRDIFRGLQKKAQESN